MESCKPYGFRCGISSRADGFRVSFFPSFAILGRLASGCRQIRKKPTLTSVSRRSPVSRTEYRIGPPKMFTLKMIIIFFVYHSVVLIELSRRKYTIISPGSPRARTSPSTERRSLHTHTHTHTYKYNTTMCIALRFITRKRNAPTLVYNVHRKYTVRV